MNRSVETSWIWHLTNPSNVTWTPHYRPLDTTRCTENTPVRLTGLDSPDSSGDGTGSSRSAQRNDDLGGKHRRLASSAWASPVLISLSPSRNRHVHGTENQIFRTIILLDAEPRVLAIVAQGALPLGSDEMPDATNNGPRPGPITSLFNAKPRRGRPGPQGWDGARQGL